MSQTTLEILDVANRSDEVGDAVNFFLSAPSFSTKQRALELLLRQIYLDSMQNSGTPVRPS